MLGEVSGKLNDDTDRITIRQHCMYACGCGSKVVVVVVGCHTLGSNWSDRCLPLPL